MSVWRLEPVDTENANWRASSYCGTVVIRAESEERARDIATLVFGRAARKILNQDTPFVPWGSDGLVRCTALNGDEFDEEGPEAILDPERYDRHFRRLPSSARAAP